MPGIADLLYLGQPDPSRQLAAMLSGQQPQGQPPGAAPPGATPAPPGGAAAAGPNAAPAPGGGSAPNPSPGDPAPPNAQPQPQALQSTPQMNASYQTLANPPNLMSLYLQMQQRQQAEAGFNSGLALIAANHSPPSMRQSIMQALTGNQGDASGMVSNIMSLYGAQNQMAAQQAMLGQADAIDQKNNWPPGTARAEILAGRGPDLIKSMEPTEMARNYQWAHDTYAKNHPGASPEEIDAGAQSILLGAGGGGAAGGEIAAMNIARSHWLADQANQGKPPPGYMTDLTKWKIYSQDLNDARTQFGGVNDSLGKFVGDMSEVANNPSLDKITGSVGGILTGAFAGLAPGEVNDLKTHMKGLADEAKDMASRGGPKGVNQNLKTLGSSPDDFTNASLTNYRDTVIAPRMRQALTAQANANGAAGQANSMPGYLKHYLDPMYQSGGELDIGGSPKATSPDTGPNGKPLPPPDAAHMQDFWMALEHRGPKFALDNLKNAGFDTSSLR